MPDDLTGIDFTKIREYGGVGFVCMVLLRYGGQILTFVLELLGVTIKRRQSTEDELRGRVSELETQFARLWAYSAQFSDTVVEMAAAMDAEMTSAAINNRVLATFIRRLRNLRRLTDVFPAGDLPPSMRAIVPPEAQPPPTAA